MVGERTLSVGGRMRRANVILRRAAASFAFAAVILSRFSARARAEKRERITAAKAKLAAARRKITLARRIRPPTERVRSPTI